MTDSYVRHDSFVCVTWLIRTGDSDSFVCKTWLIRIWDMTHSYVRLDTFVCGTWLIHICDLTHAYVSHDSFVCVTWLIRMCDMTHSYVSHDSFVCVTWLIRMLDVLHDSFVRIQDLYVCNHACAYTIQDAAHPYDVLSLHVISRKITLQLLVLLRKATCNLRHPVGLRHPVCLTCHTWGVCVCVCMCMWSVTWVVSVTWLIRTCDMPALCIGHDSIVCMPKLTRDLLRVTSQVIHMCGSISFSLSLSHTHTHTNTHTHTPHTNNSYLSPPPRPPITHRHVQKHTYSRIFELIP